MKFGDWNAQIEQRFDRMDLAMYLYRMTPAGREVLTKDGVVILQEGQVKDDLAFATFNDVEQLQALASAISTFGIKTDDDHKIQGVLEAQTKHLEDMRKLVFKEKHS